MIVFTNILSFLNHKLSCLNRYIGLGSLGAKLFNLRWVGSGKVTQLIRWIEWGL